MARIIDVEFNDKTYSIEYDRRAVYRLMEAKEDATKSQFDQVVDLIYFGLLHNHEKEMPSREDIFYWITVIDDLQGFANELAKCVQDVLTSIDKDKEKGNVKWGVRK